MGGSNVRLDFYTRTIAIAQRVSAGAGFAFPKASLWIIHIDR